MRCREDEEEGDAEKEDVPGVLLRLVIVFGTDAVGRRDTESGREEAGREVEVTPPPKSSLEHTRIGDEEDDKALTLLEAVRRMELVVSMMLVGFEDEGMSVSRSC